MEKIDLISSEKASLEGEIQDLNAQKEELDMKMLNLQTEAERSFAQIKADSESSLYELFCK